MPFPFALFGLDDTTVLLIALLVVFLGWILGNWQLPHWKKGAERRL